VSGSQSPHTAELDVSLFRHGQGVTTRRSFSDRWTFQLFHWPWWWDCLLVPMVVRLEERSGNEVSSFVEMIIMVI
jgi:hypothetical protein